MFDEEEKRGWKWADSPV